MIQSLILAGLIGVVSFAAPVQDGSDLLGPGLGTDFPQAPDPLFIGVQVGDDSLGNTVRRAAVYCEGAYYSGGCISQGYTLGECTRVDPAYRDGVLSFSAEWSTCELYDGTDCTGASLVVYSSILDLRLHGLRSVASYRCSPLGGYIPSVPVAGLQPNTLGTKPRRTRYVTETATETVYIGQSHGGAPVAVATQPPTAQRSRRIKYVTVTETETRYVGDYTTPSATIHNQATSIPISLAVIHPESTHIPGPISPNVKATVPFDEAKAKGSDTPPPVEKSLSVSGGGQAPPSPTSPGRSPVAPSTIIGSENGTPQSSTTVAVSSVNPGAQPTNVFPAPSSPTQPNGPSQITSQVDNAQSISQPKPSPSSVIGATPGDSAGGLPPRVGDGSIKQPLLAIAIPQSATSSEVPRPSADDVRGQVTSVVAVPSAARLPVIPDKAATGDQVSAATPTPVALPSVTLSADTHAQAPNMSPFSPSLLAVSQGNPSTDAPLPVIATSLITSPSRPQAGITSSLSPATPLSSTTPLIGPALLAQPAAHLTSHDTLQPTPSTASPSTTTVAAVSASVTPPPTLPTTGTIDASESISYEVTVTEEETVIVTVFAAEPTSYVDDIDLEDNDDPAPSGTSSSARAPSRTTDVNVASSPTGVESEDTEEEVVYITSTHARARPTPQPRKKV